LEATTVAGLSTVAEHLPSEEG